MANFIPPLGGVFKPNSADISSWLYQIWQYLQDNPIANIDELRTLIADTLPAEVATAVAEYLEEHPVEVDYPVDSVNGRTGAVTIEYAELVNGTTLPIYRASNDEFGPNDLLEAYNEGCRFAVQDDSLFFVMLKNNNAITLLPITGGGGGGGSGGDGIQSINSTIRPDGNGNVVVTASNLPMSSSNTTTIKSAIEAITPGPTMAQIVNTIYPVGSIYISTAAADPSTLFSGTQWEAIQGRFLLAASTSHPAGQMDGEETHTLTINEMPSHTHQITFANSALAAGSARRTPQTHDQDRMETMPTGGGQPHNNMPPYLAVYMWKRTA